MHVCMCACVHAVAHSTAHVAAHATAHVAAHATAHVAALTWTISTFGNVCSFGLPGPPQ